MLEKQLTNHKISVEEWIDWFNEEELRKIARKNKIKVLDNYTVKDIALSLQLGLVGKKTTSGRKIRTFNVYIRTY